MPYGDVCLPFCFRSAKRIYDIIELIISKLLKLSVYHVRESVLSADPSASSHIISIKMHYSDLVQTLSSCIHIFVCMDLTGESGTTRINSPVCVYLGASSSMHSNFLCTLQHHYTFAWEMTE